MQSNDPAISPENTYRLQSSQYKALSFQHHHVDEGCQGHLPACCLR